MLISLVKQAAGCASLAYSERAALGALCAQTSTVWLERRAEKHSELATCVHTCRTSEDELGVRLLLQRGWDSLASAVCAAVALRASASRILSICSIDPSCNTD